MGLPLVANICCTVFGWGPAVTVFWWEGRLRGWGVSSWGWRFVDVELGRVEICLQWI